MTENSVKKNTMPIETEDQGAENTADPKPADNDASQNGRTENLPENDGRLKKLEQDVAEKHDQLLRVSADFENYKKRMNRQMDDLRKYANESLLKDLLSVVDNLERAINSAAQKTGEPIDSCVLEGVEMTLGEITKLLTRYNVTPIEAMGKPFDPAYHEAVMQEPSREYPENTVVNEFQKGYMIHDRLLRPAMVVVSKGQP